MNGQRIPNFVRKKSFKRRYSKELLKKNLSKRTSRKEVDEEKLIKRNCPSERSQKMLLNYVLAFANDAPAVRREKITWVNVETSCFF